MPGNRLLQMSNEPENFECSDTRGFAMYLPDLSPYGYMNYESMMIGTRSIGWLDRKHPYPVGKTSIELQSRLLEYCKTPVNVTRGRHLCPFCKFSEEELENLDITYYSNAEIRVIHSNGVFAAPTLVWHYVTEHQYLPPQEFIDAVLNGPPPSSIAYQRFLESYRNAEKLISNIWLEVGRHVFDL